MNHGEPVTPSQTRTRLKSALARPDLGDEERGTLAAELAQACLQDGDVEGAMAAARTAITSLPDRQEGWQSLAQALVHAREWDALLGETGAAQRRFPDSAWPWEYVQKAYLGKGDIDNAIRAGLAGLHVERTSPRLWEGMAESFWRKGQYRAAQDAITAIREYGGSARLADALALRIASAVRDHPEVIRLGSALFGSDLHGVARGRDHGGAELPLDRDGMLAWAEALLHDGDARRAMAAATALIADDESDASGWIVAASAQAALGDFAAASTAQDRALERLQAADADTWHALLTYQLAAGQVERAVASGQRALREHGVSPALWLLMARALDSADRLDTALYAATMARLLCPDDARSGAVLHALVERAPDQARRKADELRIQGERAGSATAWSVLAGVVLDAIELSSGVNRTPGSETGSGTD
jgi:tetratricopeptide (TPR) repeat protein